MKLRRYCFAVELIADLLRTGAEHHVVITEGLPAGAIVRGAYTGRDTVDLVVESAEFAEVDERMDPPVHDLLVQRVE